MIGTQNLTKQKIKFLINLSEKDNKYKTISAK